MNDVCPVHGEPWKTVPAGVSKRTGNAYPAFLACPVRDCRERPQSNLSPEISPTTPSPVQTPNAPVEPAQRMEATLSQGIALLHGRVKDLGNIVRDFQTSVNARLDGIEAQQQRTINGVGMVLSEIKSEDGEERLDDEETTALAEKIK